MKIRLLLNRIFQRKALVIFALILLLAGFLRIYRLGVQSFIADEYLGVKIGYGYQQSGEWKMWNFNDSQLTDEKYTRAQVYYWQVAQVLRFLPPTEAVSRLISVIWGLIGVVLVFFGAKYITKNPKLALIAAFLLAVSITALTYDRKLRMYSMFATTFFALSIFVFAMLEILPKKMDSLGRFSKKIGLNIYLVPVVLVLGYLNLKVHLLAVNIIPIVFAYLLIMVIVEFKKTRSFKNKYFIYLLIGIAAFFVSIKNIYIHSALKFFDPPIYHWTYLQKILADYSYILTSAAILAVGSWFMVKKYGKAGLWVVLSLLVPLSMAMFVWDWNAGQQYIHFTHLFKVVIFAAGIYYLAKIFSKCLKIKYAEMTLIACLIFFSLNLPFFFSGKSFYGEPKNWDYPNYRESFAYVLDKKGDNDILITRNLTKYYLNGSHTDTFIYGSSDNKLTKESIIMLQQNFPAIWLVTSEDDFNIKSEAQDYIEENFELIKTKYTNGDIQIWRWKKQEV